MTENLRPESVIDARIAEAATAAKQAHDKVLTTRAFIKWNDDHGKVTDAKILQRLEDQKWAASVRQSEYEAECEAYDGWSRFFLVQANNGHIHKWMSCSTCYPTTEYAWLPELSGLTEADAVEELGGILCSVCFPDAPVEWTTGTNKREAAAKSLAAAIKEIERSPEAKKVKSAKDLRDRKLRKLEGFESARKRLAEAQAAGKDVPEWFFKDVARADAEQMKTEREYARAVAKHEAALDALQAALVVS